MLETLITSKTRIKLLLKFFLNPETFAHLRGLETEFGESTNSIRLELNRLENANMILSLPEGNKKLFRVNTHHPLFNDIQNIVKKFIGIDVIIENVINRLGALHYVYVGGNLANGKDDKVIDLIFVGSIDKNYLMNLAEKAEELIKRKIRFLVYSPGENPELEKDHSNYLLIWQK